MKKIFIAGHKGMVGSVILNKLIKRNKIYTIDKNKLNLIDQNKTLNYFKKK